MKKKNEYKGGKCSNCSYLDIFWEHSIIQITLDYCRKNHCCYSCGEQALRKRSKQLEEK